jgi:adenylate kinase
VCDLCGSELYQRDDDKEETICKRLKVYDKQTEPLISYYEGESLLRTVIGTGSIEEIKNKIIAILEGKD